MSYIQYPLPGKSSSTTPTGSTLVLRDASGNAFADNFVDGYATTATAAGTTTLTVDSVKQQHFTGATTQNCDLPVASTMSQLGMQFDIVNTSSGVVTVRTSAGTTVQAMAANTRSMVKCILLSGTTAASWQVTYMPLPTAITGTGSNVLSISPTFTGTVTSAAETITGQITNSAGPAILNKDVVANTSTAYTIDPANGTNFRLTLTGNCTLTLATAPVSPGAQELIVELIQDSTANRTVAFSNATFATGVTPYINPLAGAKTYVTIKGDAGAWTIFSLSSGLAVTDASVMASGYLGEVLTFSVAIASAVALTTATAANVLSFTLPAGDWFVSGVIGIIPAGTTLPTVFTGSINSVSATQATSPNGGAYFSQGATFIVGLTQIQPVGGIRINTSASATYYLVCTTTFTVSTCTAYGYVTCQRRR